MRKNHTPFRVLLFLCTTIISLATTAQGTLLLRQPSAGKQHIVFVHGDDLWVVAREGGDARRLTTAVGAENNPRISADGKWVAFTGQYDGNTDVYLVSIDGGAPKRLTWHPTPDLVQGWSNDNKIIFTSDRMGYPTANTKFYTVATTGGTPEPMILPFGFAPRSTSDTISALSRRRFLNTLAIYHLGSAPQAQLELGAALDVRPCLVIVDFQRDDPALWACPKAEGFALLLGQHYRLDHVSDTHHLVHVPCPSAARRLDERGLHGPLQLVDGDDITAKVVAVSRSTRRRASRRRPRTTAVPRGPAQERESTCAHRAEERHPAALRRLGARTGGRARRRALHRLRAGGRARRGGDRGRAEPRRLPRVPPSWRPRRGGPDPRTTGHRGRGPPGLRVGRRGLDRRHRHVLRALWVLEHRHGIKARGVWFGLDADPNAVDRLRAEAERCGVGDRFFVHPRNDPLVKFCGDVAFLPCRSPIDGREAREAVASGLGFVAYEGLVPPGSGVTVVPYLDVDAAGAEIAALSEIDRRSALQAAAARIDAWGLADFIIRTSGERR